MVRPAVKLNPHAAVASPVSFPIERNSPMRAISPG
jgi:hypothetical protein